MQRIDFRLPSCLLTSSLPVLAILSLTAALAGCGALPVSAGPAASEASNAPALRAGGIDYGKPENWLCRPDREDVCDTPLTVATVRPEGGTGRETWRPSPAVPIDCFYVYPTISMDESPNSDMNAGPEEKRAAQQQFAPFGSECRLFAPLYRQITVPALRSRYTPTPMPANAQMAYDDVRDAWLHYLAHDNKGRGVVLIGHSQGTRMLSQLIAREIEGKPVQSRIVSAILLGANIAVPKGKDVGGAFKSMPLCRAANQTGCVIAYTAFRASSPPPSNTLFGRIGLTAIGDTDPATSSVACTNPAALAGGSAPLRAYLPTRANLMGEAIDKGTWGTQVQDLDTTFVSVPGLLSAQCVENENGSYLAVTVNPLRGSPGADIAGDVTYDGRVLRDWGLHLVDVNLGLGNLTEIVRQQAQAWTASRR